MHFMTPEKLTEKITFSESEDTVRKLAALAPGQSPAIVARTLLRLVLDLVERGALHVTGLAPQTPALEIKPLGSSASWPSGIVAPEDQTRTFAGFGAAPHQAGKTIAKRKGFR